MFNNPYIGGGTFSRDFGAKAINWSKLLDGTQKTLGVINQAIPIIYQVKPVLNNARTMFRIADVMKNSNFSEDSDSKKANNSDTNTDSGKPIFYI